METREEMTPYFKKLEKREEVFRRINMGANLLILLSIIINWECFLILLALYLYCTSIFEAGYRSQVSEEWESGYIADGLRYLYKGLIALPIIILLITVAFEICGLYEYYTHFKSTSLYYIIIGVLYFFVAHDLLKTLIESYRYWKKQ